MVKYGNGELFIDCAIYLVQYLHEPPENEKEFAQYILKYLENIEEYYSRTKLVQTHWRIDLKSDSISEIISRAGKIKNELLFKFGRVSPSHTDIESRRLTV